ncbi:hypothetical protein J2Z32_000059 [Paenibacillus turicensis]|uniref:DUF5071 domain-containing protein n=1 Tax=Paenibacillus turicensis TaxID=160487 RepID=A0ABS4FLI3_9BACL|nr:DUF5071 domain-containing protein [Paenibacillus turicensis]MBP1903447.1 hypothetical protein [Paenibacillus turicensis]
MDIRQLLPKDKHDFDSVNKLKEYDKDALREVIPELLIWLQDTNWPISLAVRDILIQFDKELIPHFKQILNSNDGMWKYWILTELVNRLTPDVRVELTQELIRLSNEPQPYDVIEEVDTAAKELL